MQTVFYRNITPCLLISVFYYKHYKCKVIQETSNSKLSIQCRPSVSGHQLASVEGSKGKCRVFHSYTVSFMVGIFQIKVNNAHRQKQKDLRQSSNVEKG